MLIEVHLYGRLRRYGPTADVREPCVVRTAPDAHHGTVGDLVAALGIPPNEIGSVFRNGNWERDGLKLPLDGIVRLGVFPRNMTLLYV